MKYTIATSDAVEAEVGIRAMDLAHCLLSIDSILRNIIKYDLPSVTTGGHPVGTCCRNVLDNLRTRLLQEIEDEGLAEILEKVR